MFHSSIAKAAVAPPLRPRGPEEATRILQACVVAWPGVAWHGGVLAEGSSPYPYPYPPPVLPIPIPKPPAAPVREIARPNTQLTAPSSLDNAASSSPWKAFLEQQQDDLDKAYDLFVKWKSSVGDVDGAKPPPPPRTNSKTHSGNNVGGFRFHLSNKTAKPKVNVEHPTGLQNSRWIDLDSKQDFNWLPTVHRSRNAPLH